MDRNASMRKLAADPWCRSCRFHGQRVRATNCHHLLGKAQGGDDVPDALIPLCGHGSAGCHGALHGAAYLAPEGRRSSQDVRRAVGAMIKREEAMYLVERLGAVAGLEHLRSRYHVEVTLDPWSKGPA